MLQYTSKIYLELRPLQNNYYFKLKPNSKSKSIKIPFFATYNEWNIHYVITYQCLTSFLHS